VGARGALRRSLPVDAGRRAGLALLVLTVLALPAPSRPHTGGTTAFAAITVSDNGVRYSVSLFTTSAPPAIADTLAGVQAERPDAQQRLVELVREKVQVVGNGTPCAPGQGQVLPPGAEPDRVTVVVDFACARRVTELRLRDDTFDALGSEHHTLAKVTAGSEVRQIAFEPGSRDARVEIATRAGTGGSSTGFFLLGVHHILSGWDHLLFLFALLLRGGSVLSVLKIVTAFTAAHSVTLALAVLDVVTLPSRLVESVIALSIAFVAAENLAPRRALSARWMVSFAFGLVHGFGFSTALRELELPRAGLAASLLGFNLGVEAGQALVVAVVMPLLIVLARAQWAPRFVRTCSLVVLVAGVVLFVERLFLA
jgi:hydrogenase/urease accessory protein HupE